MGRTWDLAGLYIAEKARLRAAEEQKRVLYVAMTRAREHLIISCAPTGRRSNGSFLSMLDETFQESIAPPQSRKLLPSAAEALNCAWSRKTLRRSGTSEEQRRKAARSQLATLRRHVGSTAKRVRISDQAHLFSSRLHC